MSDSLLQARRDETKRPPGWRIGLLVGASLGAGTRFLAAVSYNYYLFHWGGPWFRGNAQRSDVAIMILAPSVVSAGLGLIVGGVAGATCRPRWGTLLGALLSGGIYLGLCVLPTEFGLAMNAGQHGGNWGWEQGERLQILLGVIPMLAAGALAGGVGAAVGHRRRNKGMEKLKRTVDT